MEKFWNNQKIRDSNLECKMYENFWLRNMEFMLNWQQFSCLLFVLSYGLSGALRLERLKNVGRKNHTVQKVSLTPYNLDGWIWNSEYESDSNAPIETIVDIEEISGDTYESQSEEKEFDSNDTARNISDIEWRHA